ncbi:protein SLC31A2 isoform X3 [Ptiloglossa arizonensis]|uniref:protein SLC31A2 isoform X3 n=1 Tax=Ptiloglossa arizonensis TaxID=3350558 RepID=UPI003F9F3072
MLIKFCEMLSNILHNRTLRPNYWRLFMHMWFWFGNNLGSFLLPGYNVITTSSFLCTCLGLTALAILYEGMKILQIKIQQNTMVLVQNQMGRTSENSSLLSKISSKSVATRSSLRCIRWSTWTFQVFHWFIHTFLGYILMLAVMTYNIYINIAIILGGCLGYWIFGPKLIKLNMTQFHNRQRLLECDKECAEQLVTEATVEVHMPRDA